MLFQHLGGALIEDELGVVLHSALHLRPMAEGFGAAILGTVVGSAYPAQRAMVLPIVEAIRYE